MNWLIIFLNFLKCIYLLFASLKKKKKIGGGNNKSLGYSLFVQQLVDQIDAVLISTVINWSIRVHSEIPYRIIATIHLHVYGSFHQVGGTICDGVNCYIRKCTIYYPWLWLLINNVVISYWRWRDWFHSNLKSNCECALRSRIIDGTFYGCNHWHRHKSCPNLVECPICVWHTL